MRDNADDVPSFEGQVIFKGDFGNDKLKPILERLFTLRVFMSLVVGFGALYLAHHPIDSVETVSWAFIMGWIGSNLVNGMIRE